MEDIIILETEEKMDKTIVAYQKDLATIRTGRANPALLDQIAIEYYGVTTPIKQISSITVPEASQLYIKPFDKSTLKAIEVALSTSSLGLTPQNDGVGLRLVIPRMTEERRNEYAKKVAKMGEAAKVAIRNVRRDANDAIKKLKLTEDDEKGYLQDIQELTDKKIVEVEKVTDDKTKEIYTI